MNRTSLTVKELADFLKISQQMVYNLVREGELEAFKVGTAMRFLEEDVMTYIGRQKRIHAALREDAKAVGTEGRLTASHVSARLGSFHLDDVSFDIPLGSSLGILGASGSGKTLLLKALAGLAPTDAGSFFMGRERLDGAAAWQRRIGFVFQDYALYPQLTGGGNISFPAHVAHKPRAEVDERVRELARHMGIGQEYLERHVHALPEGMKQMVAIARAENRDALMFLMDEPLVHLDPELRRTIRVLLAQIRRESGITGIFAFNEPEDAMALSDWILVLEQGRAVQFGPAMEVWEQPASTYVMELLAPDGLNKVAVQVRGGRTEPWNLEADVGDGDWLLCFRPDEIDLGSGVAVAVESAVLHDSKSRLVKAHSDEGQAFSLLLPEGVGDSLAFRPRGRLFPQASAGA